MQQTSLTRNNHYSVLGLPLPQNEASAGLSKEEIKAAYHRSLLLHHPDKSSTSNSRAENHDGHGKGSSQYTVEQIMRAYETLLDPVAKASYDKALFSLQSTHVVGKSDLDLSSHLGLEVVDLEDLTYDESSRSWSRSCRCGNERAFVLSEAELETASTVGEIIVECGGCSLCIRVVFGVEEDAN